MLVTFLSSVLIIFKLVLFNLIIHFFNEGVFAIFFFCITRNLVLGYKDQVFDFLNRPHHKLLSYYLNSSSNSLGIGALKVKSFPDTGCLNSKQ